MIGFIDSKVPDSKCCECGAKLNGATGVDSTPSPGDLTICIYCGSLNVFDENITLRRPTVDEYVESTKSYGIRIMREAVMKVFNENKESLSNKKRLAMAKSLFLAACLDD